MITTQFEPIDPGQQGGKGDTADAGTDQGLQPDAPPRRVEPAESAPARKPRGFAAMDKKLVSELARKGGKAAHSAGTAHEFTPEEARAAGRKGGQAAHARRRSGAASQPSSAEGGGDEGSRR